MERSKDIVYIKSGGRRIALYAELGGYFSPDGQLDDGRFRTFIRVALRERMRGDGPGHEVGVWLAEYLENVLAYLRDKGLDAAALQLFEAALDESAALGVTRVPLDPALLRGLMAAAAAPDAQRESPHRDDADDKRARLLECALEVFTSRGFHSATIDEVAAAAGVAKGTVYRYFKSKEDLLDQLLLATSQRVVERFSGAFSGVDDVRGAVEQFIREWVGFIEENHALYRLIQAEGIIAHSGRRTLFYEYLITNFPMAKERIASMNAAGELKVMSFYTVLYGVLGFIDGVVHKWFRSNMDYPLHDEIPVILETLLNGLLRDDHRGGSYCAPDGGASA